MCGFDNALVSGSREHLIITGRVLLRLLRALIDLPACGTGRPKKITRHLWIGMWFTRGITNPRCRSMNIAISVKSCFRGVSISVDCANGAEVQVAIQDLDERRRNLDASLSWSPLKTCSSQDSAPRRLTRSAFV